MHSLQIGIQIILMFFVLVTLHEWGHYYFAKRAGILVREFAIGFGPKLFSYKRGETKYTLRLLPLGGFVRMAGEDPETIQIVPGQSVALQLNQDQVTHLFTDRFDQRSDTVQGVVEEIDLEKDLFVKLDVDGESVRFPIHPQAVTVSQGRENQIAPWNRQFGSKSVGQRALAIFAGPVMNFILAFVLFLIFVISTGVPTNVKLGELVPGKPADQAGLKPGDIIKEANNQPIGDDMEKLRTIIAGSLNQPVQLIIQRNKEQLQKTVTPEVIEGTPRIGTNLTQDTRAPSVGEAVTGAWDHTVNISKQLLIGFKRLVFGQFAMDDLGGPVRIVEVSGQVASAGVTPMLYWSAILSLNLGIFNLLPIPALDGSRLVFLGVEALRGRPVDPNRESLVHFIGFAMLMLLMIAVTYNDILRLIKG
ncbi:RIP metalloprotease RseP [Paenibacillus aurantius]|uniref:Zinc metalloprotease n=1 Tax=Paenibacillus aurantius TaxID=2918900 RepID=A0AA96RHU5_9BACL|nr:RIP metalloprotease RseP [Paenibacillus aurantius]WNQ13768.1 RIP metalloprotease RseP [Paenibacillus aurantius]